MSTEYKITSYERGGEKQSFSADTTSATGLNSHYQEKFSDALKKISGLESYLFHDGYEYWITTNTGYGHPELVIIRKDPQTGKELKRVITLTTPEEIKTARLIESYLEVQFPSLAKLKGSREDLLNKIEQHPRNCKLISGIESIWSILGLSRSFVQDGTMVGMGIWGIFQPTPPDAIENPLDFLGGEYWALLHFRNLPIIKQCNTLAWDCFKGVVNQQFIGQKWSLRASLLNLLPERGVAFNLENSIDSLKTHLDSSAAVVGNTTTMVSKILTWVGAGGSNVLMGLSIAGSAILMARGLFGSGYGLVEGHKIHRFEKKVNKILSGELDPNVKIEMAFNHLLDQVWITKEDMVKIQHEVEKSIEAPSFLDRVLEVQKSPEERYVEKIQKLLAKKESIYQKRAGSVSFQLLQEEAKKRFINGSPISTLSSVEQRKIIAQMKSECRWNKIEKVGDVAFWALMAVAACFFIASTCTGQVYLLAIAFGICALAAIISLMFSSRTLYKSVKPIVIGGVKLGVAGGKLGIGGGKWVLEKINNRAAPPVEGLA